MKRTEPRFVVCVKNKGYAASLELRKIYQAVPDQAAAKLHHIRVIDESGEDYLYPESYFVAVQSAVGGKSSSARSWCQRPTAKGVPAVPRQPCVSSAHSASLRLKYSHGAGAQFRSIR
jgi:hypothetical protein